MKLSKNERRLIKRFRQALQDMGYDASRDFGGVSMVVVATKIHEGGGQTAIIAKNMLVQAVEGGPAPVASETLRCMAAGSVGAASLYREAADELFNPDEVEGTQRITGTHEEVEAERERFLAGGTTH